MILDEIYATIEFNIEGRVLDGSKMPIENNFIIPNKDNYVLNGKNFELIYKQQAVTIDEYLSVGTSHVCQIKNSDDNGNFLARLIFFGGQLLTLNEVHVLVDPSTKLFRENFSAVINRSLIKISDDLYFIIKASSSENEESISGADFAFSIITEEKNVDVKKIESTEGIYYKATKAYKRRNNTPQSNYRLVKGIFSFDNQRTISSVLTQQQLDNIRRNKSTYLDAWKEYTKERGKKVLDLARRFGHINYSNIERTPNGYRVFLDEKDVHIPQNYEIQFFSKNADTPYFLQNKDCSWNDYLLKRKEQKFERKNNPKDFEDIKQEVEAEISYVNGNCIEVELKRENEQIPESGFITISTFPEEKQIERQ